MQTWQIVTIENLVVAFAYFAIAYIVLPGW